MTVYQHAKCLQFSGNEWHLHLSTILVTNLATLERFSPSPMLIWVLQSSHWSKIRVAQHLGRRGANLVRTKMSGVNVRNLEKNQDKWLLFQRFETSIVVALTVLQCSSAPEHVSLISHPSSVSTWLLSLLWRSLTNTVIPPSLQSI